MPQCNPEDYLNVGDVELLGPSAVRLPGQPEKPEAKPLPTNPLEIQQQLFEAQRRNDHVAIQQLSMALDDSLTNVFEEMTSQPKEQVESPAQDVEEPKSDVSESEIYREIHNAVGQEQADAVHGWMNEHFEEEEIGSYLQMMQEGDQEAIGVFQAAQRAMANPELAPDSSLEEYTQLDESQSAELVDRYGDAGTQMVELNKQFISGQITQAQMIQAVLSDPALAQAAMDAKANNLLTY